MKLERGERLEGKTYKIKPLTIEEAIYITINDMHIEGELRPVEVFVNSKDMKSFQWVSCVCRLLSAVLRTKGPFPKYAIRELLDTHDPQGGYIVPHSNGYRAPSIVAHIGWVIKNHCEELGLWEVGDEQQS